MSGTGGRVTIATVAREAGRSISTVSAALNGAPGVSGATRAEILRVAAELGYEADPRARLLRAAHTGIVGVSCIAGQAFQVQLVDGLYRAAREHGHGLSLTAATEHHGEVEGVRGLVRDRCEGIVVVDSRIPYEDLASASAGLPLVVMCRPSPAPGVEAVRSDDRAGMTALVEHVLGTGRRDLVHLDGAGASCTQLRSEAFRAAMEARGLPGRVVPGGQDEEAGVRAVSVLAGRGSMPQALLCYNDHAALGALLELRRRGLRVPQDVAVAGYDDIPVAGVSAVDLTTVRQDVEVLTDTALQRLAERLPCATGRRSRAGGDRPAREDGAPLGAVGAVEHTVAPHLVVRGSTA
ncbi:LacI family DNA-binding transcriptional regulator [Actinomyces howellii]|uniref:Mgl repressor and galactose ultrainduction factor n=1 Tax=Actinomyces howellii TaxID=52771 RepID=A0A3S5EH00_9ACTO|nr:LacI family DNA-binding transcriptional regulator [Actinomyces howellii]VEG27475.1 Mgl repressor and galactose ultrainduction factor [Actinomyces howellii]